jgi:hypothetical protein
MPLHLAGPVRDALLQLPRLPEHVQDVVGDVLDRDVDARRHIDHLACHAVEIRLDQRLDRLGVVVDVEPVTARLTFAVDRERLVAESLDDEARDDLLGMLAGAVVVERARDHDRQVVGDVVAEREAVGARLGRGVGAAREQRVLLVHRCVLGRPVHLT